MPLLSVENLTLLRQQRRRRWFQYHLEEEVLIDNISFSIEKAASLAFVGEENSGKSALCLALLKLHEVSEGTITFAEVETTLFGRPPLSTAQEKDSGCILRSVRPADSNDDG